MTLNQLTLQNSAQFLKTVLATPPNVPLLSFNPSCATHKNPQS